MKVKLISIDERELKEYLIIVSRMKVMSPAKLEAAIIKAQSGGSKKEEAQKYLIEAGLKDVISIANRYRTSGITFAMLIAAGNRGLIRAVHAYNREENGDYRKYLEWEIESSVVDAIIDAGKV
ncbi:MAG: hypothetical protein LLG37_00950 [Spirochaetia bacterium]|nr:hypothetical protein [Spirochaetia bacterium]